MTDTKRLNELAEKIGRLNLRKKSRKRFNMMRAWCGLGDEEKLERAITMLEITREVEKRIDSEKV